MRLFRLGAEDPAGRQAGEADADQHHPVARPHVDEDVRLRRRRLLGTPVLGTIDEMPEIIAEARPDVVFVAISNAPSQRVDLIANACHDDGIECQLVRRELEPVLPVTEPDQLDNVTSIRSRGGR